MKPTLQYRIRQNSSNYFYVDNTGVVLVSPTPVSYYEGLVDWSTMNLHSSRQKTNKAMMGMFFNVTPETLRFSLDLATIMRTIYNQFKRADASAQFELNILNSTTQAYELLDVYDLDFSKFYSELNFVDVGIAGNALGTLIKANASTQYNIPLGSTDPMASDYDPDVVDLTVGGVLLQGSVNYQTVASGAITLDETSGANPQTPPIVYVNNSSPFQVGMSNPAYLQHANIGTLDYVFMFRTTQAINAKIRIDNLPLVLANTSFTTPAGAYARLMVKIIDKDRTTALYGPDTLATSTTLATGASGVAWNISTASISYTLGQDCYIVFYFELVSVTGGADHTLKVTFPTTPADIFIDYEFTNTPTPCRALPQYVVFNRLITALTGGAYGRRSNLLSTYDPAGPSNYNLNPQLTYFTCGDALRQLYVGADGSPKTPALTISLNDFGQDSFVRLGAGIGLEKDGSGNDIVTLEKIDNFYQKATVTYDMGEIISDDWAHEPMTENLSNNIKAGYADQSYDDISGRNEYNSEVNYKTMLRQIYSDIDFTSPFRADCYGMEFYRANLANKKTTDSSSDNDTFLLQIFGGSVVDNGQTVTRGLPASVAPTVFNMALSPKANLLRFMPWLRSNYYNMRNNQITFMNGTKNTGLVYSIYGGLSITENANLDVTPASDLSNLVYIPEYVKFSAPASLDLLRAIQANPFGVIRHTVVKNGAKHMIEGFIVDAAINPGAEHAYNFTLLLSPNTPMPVNL